MNGIFGPGGHTGAGQAWAERTGCATGTSIRASAAQGPGASVPTQSLSPLPCEMKTDACLQRAQGWAPEENGPGGVKCGIGWVCLTPGLTIPCLRGDKSSGSTLGVLKPVSVVGWARVRRAGRRDQTAVVWQVTAPVQGELRLHEPQDPGTLACYSYVRFQDQNEVAESSE